MKNKHITSLSNSLNQEVKLPLPLQIKSSRSEYRINSLFSRLIGFLGETGEGFHNVELCIFEITDPLYLPLKRGRTCLSAS